MSLKGRIALVTGGSRGIGKAITLKLASEGADVIINFLRRREAAERTAEEVREMGVSAHTIKANLAEPEKIDRMFHEIQQEHGRLDILVNNAASGVARMAIEIEPDEWDWTMNINARAVLICTQRAAQLMPTGSSVINISSLGSRLVMPVYTAVGVSKAALEALTRYLAIELSEKDIRVNGVSAAAVATEALKFYAPVSDLPTSMINATPAGRMVQPQDVAGVVSFLCSDAAEMIRGQIITVDGGISLTTLIGQNSQAKGNADGAS